MTETKKTHKISEWMTSWPADSWILDKINWLLLRCTLGWTNKKNEELSWICLTLRLNKKKVMNYDLIWPESSFLTGSVSNFISKASSFPLLTEPTQRGCSVWFTTVFIFAFHLYCDLEQYSMQIAKRKKKWHYIEIKALVIN